MIVNIIVTILTVTLAFEGSMYILEIVKLLKGDPGPNLNLFNKFCVYIAPVFLVPSSISYALTQEKTETVFNQTVYTKPFYIAAAIAFSIVFVFGIILAVKKRKAKPENPQ